MFSSPSGGVPVIDDGGKKQVSIQFAARAIRAEKTSVAPTATRDRASTCLYFRAAPRMDRNNGFWCLRGG